MEFINYTSKTRKEISRELKVREDYGLSNDEAKKRTAQYGYNELISEKVSGRDILLRQLKSPFIYLLVFAACLAIILQESIEGMMIFGFVIINSAIGFFQEFRSEQTLRLLKQYVIKRARVRREGREDIINSKELVPGDIVILETGDVIPADIRFLEENDLMVDESILTGEAVPIKKICKKLSKQAGQIYEAQNIGFSGTTVVSGKGAGIVLATGRNTSIGEIAKLTLETIKTTSFEKGISKISKFILRLISVTLVFVFLANLAIKGGRTDMIELIIFSIALAVSVIPEALPIVTTFSLSRGALRLAKKKVVVKRLSAIEDLGGVEILCTDKTGTLTENKLTVDNIYSNNKQQSLFYASLSSSFLNNKIREPNNAFDIALYDKLSSGEKNDLTEYSRLSEIPFDPERRRNSVLIKKGAKSELIVRGAAEEVVSHCTNLTAKERNKIQKWIFDEGNKGHRVLAVAKKTIKQQGSYSKIEEIKRIYFIGAISFADPLKKTASDAVKRAERLGIQVKILTGDSAQVAGAVALQVGLVKSFKDVITGSQLEKLSYSKKIQALKKYSVFARVSPRQKYNIIELLEKEKEVGFLGEGINDAPALKIANVALAVQDAADIARESSDIILLKKSLEVIIDGIEEGRIVFANTVKYIKATLISNFGNFFAIATASLLIDFLPMLPVQILLLNLFSDFPMISIATDNVDNHDLKRPINYNLRDIISISIILGAVSTIFDFMFFALFYQISPSVLQTNWFIGSVITELVLIFSVRTKLFFLKAKRPSWIIIGLSVLIAGLTIVFPFTAFGQEVFRFVRPSHTHIIWIVAIVIAYFAVNEIAKSLYSKFFNHKDGVQSKA